MNATLETLLDTRLNFIQSHGGHWEVNEFDQDLNDINRDIITEYYKNNPDCWVGNINKYSKDQIMMKKYEGEFVCNFEWVFIVSQFDQELLDLIEKYNRAGFSDCTDYLDMVFGRLTKLDKLNAITFMWV